MHKIRLIGLPGTGKTTRLLEILEDLLQVYEPHKIIYSSFSNAAVNEAKERVNIKFGITENQLPYFRTMHSLCLKLLRQHNYSIGRKPAFHHDFKDFLLKFREKHPKLEELIEDVTIEISTKSYISLEDRSDPISTYTLVEDPVRFFRAVFNYIPANYGCTPDQPEKFSKFKDKLLERIGLFSRYHDMFFTFLIIMYNQWTRFKVDNQLFEFGELLSTVLRDEIIPETSILIVDEFQDASFLQSELVNLWSEYMEKTIVAGDPNQAIYGFNDASPKYLNDFSCDRTILLNRSWRMPKTTIKYVKTIIQNKWVNEMEAATDKTGSVLSVDLGDIEWNKYDTIFVLGRTEMILRIVRDKLATLGILSSTGNNEHVSKLYRLYYEYMNKDLVSLELLVELNNRLPRSNSLIDAQASKLIDEIERDELNTKEIPHEIVNSLLNIKYRNQLGIKINMMLTNDQRKMFQTMVNHNKPITSLNDLEKINLMTMHASKGKEADLVVLITAGSWYEYQGEVDEEEEERVYFVAATRTRQDLALVNLENMERTQFLPDPSVVKDTQVH